MATDPKSRARDAFADLPTAEKTAFVIEATFQTIGEALRETGQRLADVIQEFDPDEFFQWPADAPEADEPSTEAKAAAAKKPAATASAATKKAPTKRTTKSSTSTSRKTTGKTAGRTKKDDDA